MNKLDSNQKHMLKLIRKGERESADGWAKVSATISVLLLSEKQTDWNPIPPSMYLYEQLAVGGRARLTELGNQIVDAMEYL